MASIPLHCNVCPKKPTFSDISHLLTHIGSKGHLSHYFKVQVRSRQDEAARQTLQAYNDWYDSNQIESLLSERMVLKDLKNPKGRGKAPRSQHPTSTRSTSKKTAKPKPIRTVEEDEEGREGSLIDPQLSYHSIPLVQQSNQRQAPLSPDLDCVTRSLVPYFSSIGGAHRHSGQDPLIRRPTTLQNRFSDGEESDDETDDYGLLDEETIRCMYPEPPQISQLPPMPDFLPRVRTNSPSPSLYTRRARDGISNTTDNVDSEEETFKDLVRKIPECVKLKGTVWPGMDLFDSANPEAQRRRNQKKDGSVLLQMRVASETVMPNELIFDQAGDLLKVRQITGEVESSSPIKELEPKPRTQRVNAKRNPLNAISSNIPRGKTKARTRSDSRTKKETEHSVKDILSQALAAQCEFALTKQPKDNASLGTKLPKRKPISKFGGQLTRKKLKVFEDEPRSSTGPSTMGNKYERDNRGHPWVSAPQQDPLNLYNPHPAAPSYNSRPLVVKDPNIMLSRNRSFANPQTPFVAYPHFPTNENKENDDPFSDPRFGQPNMSGTARQHERSTQRYYTEYATQTPRFNDHWPLAAPTAPIANMSYGYSTPSRPPRRLVYSYANASESDRRTVNPLAVHHLQRPYTQKVSQAIPPSTRTLHSLPVLGPLPQRLRPGNSPAKKMTRAEGSKPEEKVDAAESSGDETIDDEIDGGLIWFGSPDE